MLAARAAVQRVHVARPQPRTPPGDGQQRYVEPAGQLGHPVEQLGVAGEVDLARAPDDEAERGRTGAAGMRRSSWRGMRPR